MRIHTTVRMNLENATCQKPDTEVCIVREMPRIGKSVETERSVVVARGLLGMGVGGAAGDRVSVWGEENLELDSGDGCAVSCMN